MKAQVPINLLEAETENIYELSSAMIRRVSHLWVMREEHPEEIEDGKIVSLAIKQVLNRTVQYRIEW